MRSCEKSSLRGSNATEAIRFLSSLRGSGDSHNEAIQNKKYGLPRFCFAKSRNDESIADLRIATRFCNDNSAHFVFARRFIAEAIQK